MKAWLTRWVSVFTAISLAAPLLAAPALWDTSLIVTQVIASLEAPSAMSLIGPDNFLILEKNTGRVQRVTGGVLPPATLR